MVESIAQRSSSPAADAVAAALLRAFVPLRRSIGELLVRSGCDPSEPQAAARALGLHRNLTWKLSKVVGEGDLFEAMQHLPGAEGLGIFFDAVARRTDGACGEELASGRAAAGAFGDVMKSHAGDRSTLDLMLEGMVLPRGEDTLEASRKLAFRGNSGIWGIQARVRAVAMWVAPNAADGSRVDSGLVGGLVDVRRLRAGVRWPLFRPRAYDEAGRTIHPAGGEIAVDPAYQEVAGPKLIGAFCTGSMPPIERIDDGRGGSVYELSAGPIGNTGVFTCFFGVLSPALGSRLRSEGETHGEVSAQVSIPSEWLLLDLCVHRAIWMPGVPEVSLRAAEGSAAWSPGQQIPLGHRPVELQGRPAAVETPLVPRYDALVSQVCARMGRGVDEFRVMRLVVPYPPMHTVFAMRFPLEERGT